MKTVVVQLPDDLAAFVEQAVQDGNFASTDELFGYALGLARTECVLGRIPVVESRPVPISPTPAAPVAIDLTRQGFDSPAFMATLVGKLEKRKDDERSAKPLR